MMVRVADDPSAIDLLVSADEYDLLIRALAIAANRLDLRAKADSGGPAGSPHRKEATLMRTLKAQLWRNHQSHQLGHALRDVAMSAGAQAS